MSLIQMSQISVPLFNEKNMPEFKHARSTTLLQNYDPAAYPPDLVFAEQHGLSRRVGEYVPPLENIQRCRCCLEPIHKKQLPLSVDLINLFHLGTSTPLYFQFLKQCIYLLIINLIIVTLPALLINFTLGEQCGIIEGGVEGILNTICRGSVINVMNVKQLMGMEMLSWFFFSAVVVNILLIGYLQLRMDLLVERYQEGRLKAVNYSLMIKGLPSDITISQIQKYIQDKMLYSGAPDLAINKIYIIFNFKNYLTMVQRRQQITEKIIKLTRLVEVLNQENLASTQYEKKVEIQKEKQQKERVLRIYQTAIQKVQEQISVFEEASEKIRRRIALGDAVEDDSTKKIMNFSGKVIITVNNRRSQKKVLEKYPEMSCCQRVSYSISELLEGEKTKVVISRAPDPEDIIFANMGSKRTTIWKSRLLYSTLIFFLLCLNFLIVALARKFLKEEKALQNGNIIFSFLNSIIVSLFCSIFRRIVKISQEQSYYNTESRQGYKIVLKVVIVFMINMFFTTLMANAISFYIITNDHPNYDGFPLNFESFVYDCFFLIATNPVFSILLDIFDHRQLRNVIKQWRIKKGSLPVSQGQANQSFQNMNFDLCYKYGTIYRFLIFSAAIAILYPLSFFICLLAFVAFYWLDKYFLLRRYSIGLKMNSRFTLMTQKIMAQFPIYLSLTTFIVVFIPVQEGSAFEELHYSKVYYYFSGIAVGLSLLNYLVGYRWMKNVFRAILKIRDRQEEQEFPQYKQIENDLQSDYSHHYHYFRVTKMIKRQETEEVRVEKVKQLRENQKLGTFDLIKHYMSQKRYDQ